MSDRMTCPGCDARTSSVLRAYLEGDPCPYCGLPHEAMAAIVSVRKERADEALLAKYEEAITRATKAEAELERLREFFGEIEGIVEQAKGATR